MKISRHKRCWNEQISANGTHAGLVLQAALLKVLKERGQKGPLKYVERISVEHVSLGCAPPTLYTVRAQSSPTEKLLRLDFGIDFAPAAGFRVVVSTQPPGSRSRNDVHCPSVVRAGI